MPKPFRLLTFLSPLYLLLACSAGPDAAKVASSQTTQSASHESKSPQQKFDHFHSPVNTADDAPLVEVNPHTGKLHYGLYANRGDTQQRNIVPDFSHAGYMGGGVALPGYQSIPNLKVLTPSEGDDSKRIQAALDAVATKAPDARGIRGAVLLKAGVYRVSTMIKLRHSGVVLRGEGQQSGGTVIRSTVAGSKAPIIQVGTKEKFFPSKASDNNRQAISSTYVATGSRVVDLISAEGFKVGDRIALVRTPNELWLSEKGVNTARYGWTVKSYAVPFERRITQVSKNAITLDIPIVDTIEQRFGGGYLYRINTSKRIHQVGVENLRVEGNPKTSVENNSGSEGPYFGVLVHAAENSWIRDLTVRFISHGVATNSGAHFNTFQDLVYIDPRFGATEGGRRYAFLIEGNSTANLFQRCYGSQARHTFISGAFVPGPNVFLDSLAENASNDSGPHHRWATGTLYDNTKGYMLRVQNRRTSGTGHAWAGAQQMLWNVMHEKIVLQAPPGAMNWSVGVAGKTVPGSWGPEESSGIVESYGKTVAPRSLYLQQLHDRLGAQAVRNVVSQTQITARVWDELSERAGRAKR